MESSVVDFGQSYEDWRCGLVGDSCAECDCSVYLGAFVEAQSYVVALLV